MNRNTCLVIALAIIALTVIGVLWIKDDALKSEGLEANISSSSAPVAQVKLSPTSGARPSSKNEGRGEDKEQNNDIVEIHIVPSIKLAK